MKFIVFVGDVTVTIQLVVPRKGWSELSLPKKKVNENFSCRAFYSFTFTSQINLRGFQ